MELIKGYNYENYECEAELEDIYMNHEGVEGIRLKTFKNGDLTIKNVPFVYGSRKGLSGEFVPCEVFQELSTIFRFMLKEHVIEYDYLNKNEIRETEEDVVFYVPSLNLDNETEVIDYVLKEWFEPYYEMRLKANSIVVAGSEQEKEKKKNQKKLELIEEKLEELPELHREIIQMKYLQPGSEGRFQLDDIVHTSLGLGRTTYYKRRKEALYWLGLSILSS